MTTNEQSQTQPSRKHNSNGNAERREFLDAYVFGKVQPQATQLEEAIIGACLIDKQAFPTVSTMLTSGSFYLDKHGYIWQAMISLDTDGEPIDLLTVTERMRKQGTLDKVGGGYYLVELSHRVASAANIEYHARIVVQKQFLRTLIETSVKATKDAYEDTVDVLELLDRTEKEILQIRHFKDGGHKTPEQLNMEVLKDLEQRQQTIGLVGVPAGITELDRKLGGFQDTDLIIIAGRPGMGKTGAALTFALNAARDFEKPIGVFSLEMAGTQLQKRLISMDSRVDSEKMRTGKLDDHEWQKIGESVQRLNGVQIHIDDTAAISILDLRAKARRMKQQFGIKMIVVDYLQLMTIGDDEGKGKNREQEIAYISRRLKALAKEMKIPVVALAQLSRAVEVRGGNKRPQLSDLRESGSIENDADVIIFIYRPEYYKIFEDKEGRSLRGIAEFIIAKNRHGGLGTVYCAFEANQTLFEDLPIGSSFNDDDEPKQRTGSTGAPVKHYTEPKREENEDIPF